MIMSAMDKTIKRALLAVAGELQTTMVSMPEWAGGAAVRESDLQRAVCNALQAQLGSIASVEGPLPVGVKECWAGWLGRVDVLARGDDSSETFIETKLCVSDMLYEALWDALKMALVTSLLENSSGYLIYAAPEAGWTPREDRPVEMFEDGTVEVFDLLWNRHANAWSWCLSGTKTTRPLSLPAELTTVSIGSAAIHTPSSDWELRCVRVQGDAHAGWIKFDGEGWPQAE
jgi:hypothetical protein